MAYLPTLVKLFIPDESYERKFVRAYTSFQFPDSPVFGFQDKSIKSSKLEIRRRRMIHMYTSAFLSWTDSVRIEYLLMLSFARGSTAVLTVCSLIRIIPGTAVVQGQVSASRVNIAYCGSCFVVHDQG